MKRSKKEGDRHLHSAFTNKALYVLESKLKQEDSDDSSLAPLLKICMNKDAEQNGLEQIAILKEVGNQLKELLATCCNDTLIKVLFDSFAYLFIKCKSKHPARRAITSILHTLPEWSTQQVIQYLTKNLLEELRNSHEFKDGLNFQIEGRRIVETLMAFTENFPLGRQVINNCSHEAFQFLTMLLSQEIPNARLSKSLEIQSNAMSNCLSAIKTTIAILHCNILLEEKRKNISSPGNKVNTSTLYEILKYCLDILQNDDFMLDCRSAAGVAVVATLQFLLPIESLKNLIEILLIEWKNLSLDGMRKQLLPKGKILHGENAYLEEQIVDILLEKLVQAQSFRSSRLILCHGLITKLDSSILHDGEQVSSELGQATEEHLPGLRSTSHNCADSEGEYLTKNEHDSGIDLRHRMTNLEISSALRSGPSEIEDGGLDEEAIGSADKCDSEIRRRTLFTDSILDCLLDICSTVNEKGLTVYAFRSLNCWTTEAYNHCKALLGVESETTDLGFYSPSCDTTPKLLRTLNGYLDHPVDAVRHQVRHSLEKVIKIINLFPDSEAHINMLLGNWLHGNLKIRSKCLSLICVLDHISATKFLEIRKSLPFDLLDCLNDCNLSSCICDLYVKSATCHFSEIREGESQRDSWLRIWCEPVFKAISLSDRIRRTYITDYIVPGLLKAFPGLINVILEKSRDLENTRDYVITTIVFLSCARGLRDCAKLDLAAKRVDCVSYWHGLARMEFMELCLCHIDEQVRLDCLALICESNKSTEVLQQQDFQLLKFFIPLNMTSQSPKFRSRFVCCIKKAVSRITDRCKQIRKASETLVLNDESSSRDSMLSKELLDCKAFVKWLLDFLFSGLHTAACFPRIVTALEIMATILKVISEIDLNNADALNTLGSDACDIFQVFTEDVFSKDRIRTLISCLHDTFDVNRSLANEILMMLPCDIFSFTQDELLNLFEEGLQLAYSPQPDEANSAPEIMKFLANGSIKKMTVTALNSKYKLLYDNSGPKECFYHAHLIILRLLTEKLNEQLRIAESGLSKAALEGPLHGTIQCIRQLLRTVKIQKVRSKIIWQSLIAELITMSLRVTDVVGPVIQSNAPEGSLDEAGDHNVMVAEVLGERESSIREVEAQAHLSQMLLVCCWRSMKEAVLLLGDIVHSVPIYEDSNKDKKERGEPLLPPSITTDMKEKIKPFGRDEESLMFVDVVMKNSDESIDVSQPADNFQSSRVESSVGIENSRTESRHNVKRDLTTGLLSSKIAVEIGNVFIDILLSSRHVGAFELAYLGFVKVCDSFWRSQFESLKVLPTKWINDLLETLRSVSSSSALCSTRRSAGIPFYISAICSTEPIINKRKTFHLVMKVLVELSRSVASKLDLTNDDVISQKVITLNILRAMFRDSKFGEDVFPYASDGLMIAVKGFSSSIWAIRNACTLLFSALMSRVFGVRKFPMSGNEFFSRFPAMYSFMKTEIEVVAEQFSSQSNRIHLHPSVFPLLLLLSHLYPSSMDGNDSKMKLRAFAPHIQRCGRSGVYKTRTMAARALASIVTPGELVETVQSLISNLPTDGINKEICHNHINGCLLQIQELLRGKMADRTVSSSLKKQIIDGPLLSFRDHLWLVSSDNLCSFNKALFFELINATIVELNGEDWHSLSPYVRDSFLNIIEASFQAALDELHLSGLSSIQAVSLQSLKRSVGYELLRKNCSIFLQKCLKYHNFKHLVTDGRDAEVVKLEIVLKLLKSDFYDVRELVLHWLCKDGKSEIQKEAVTLCLQERLLKSETEVECLAEICNALLASSHSKNFPWIMESGKSFDCMQVWKCLQANFQPSKKSESLNAAVQMFTTVLICGLHNSMKQMGDVVKSTAFSCVAEMFDFVSSFCRPEESLLTRMESAKVIASVNYINFMTDVELIDSESSELAFKYWKCIIDLIQDEDADIRCSVSASIFPLICKFYPQQDSAAFARCTTLPPGFCVQPSYMLQVIIKSLSGLYSDLPEKVCNFFMSLILGKSADFISLIADMPPSEEHPKIHALGEKDKENGVVVFEEGEANSYKEDLTLGHIVFEEIQNMICLKNLGPKLISRGYAKYIKLAINKYINIPNLFLARSEMKTSCQIIMGFCILLALDTDAAFLQTKKDFCTLCRKIDLLLSEGYTIENYALVSHLQTAKWICGE
ncbi:tRNA (32-2'-O)-methyltransferase regulator THADA-like isoform X1 [Rhopilema esculentum]|uniref:tRNA (32-2'-O)-methyltransferase regulator THADA-like isoform X1 n=1 Tax=Rhopilema esculentum TaxID=499914 RepID=UPI0031D78D9D